MINDWSQKPSHLQAMFEWAFVDYRRQTGINLADHPLARRFEGSNSIESAVDVLREQAPAISSDVNGDRLAKSLEGTVSVLYALSNSAEFSEATGLPLSCTKAIFAGLFAGLSILLAASHSIKGPDAPCYVPFDLFETIGRFLNHLHIYTKLSPTEVMDDIIVNILVGLFSALALVTNPTRHKRSVQFVTKLLREKHIEEVLQRLDRLTLAEDQATAVQTLEVDHCLVQNMKMVMTYGMAFDDKIRVLELSKELRTDLNWLKEDTLRNWLSPPDPLKNHNIACGSRLTGTASWFIQGNILSEWKSSGPSSLLWIHSKPGGGKSVLCSSIIQDIDAMRKYGLASLAFFYCSFGENQKHDWRGLLTSLLVQLCYQSDSYSDILSNFYLEHARGSYQPSDDALSRCLKNLLQIPGQAPVYLILDALDECPNTPLTPSPRVKVLSLVEELVDLRISNLRICVTSRPEADIKVVLDPLSTRSVALHDESGQIEDINFYIKSVVNSDLKIQMWKPEDRKLIIDYLTENANGRFRWVYIQIDYLRGCPQWRIGTSLAGLLDIQEDISHRRSSLVPSSTSLDTLFTMSDLTSRATTSTAETYYSTRTTLEEPSLNSNESNLSVNSQDLSSNVSKSGDSMWATSNADVKERM